MATSDDSGMRPWWYDADPDLERAVAVVADQVVDAARARRRRPRGRREVHDRRRHECIDVRAVVTEVACTHRRCLDGLAPVEVVGDLCVDTDADALRGLVALLVAGGIARACRVHVRLGPRSIVVVDDPPAAPPTVRAVVAGDTIADGRDDAELTRLARRLHAAVEVARAGDGGVQAAVTLPAESLVRVD